MMSAGSCVEWLRDDLGNCVLGRRVGRAGGLVRRLGWGLVRAGAPRSRNPGVGLRCPGTLLGLTRGSGRAEVARAVLEGIAHRGADLLEAAETDSGLSIGSLRVDGGMSANRTFTQALANAIGRPVETSAVTEATTIGAAYLAGVAVGTWASLEEAAAELQPRSVIEPTRLVNRQRWLEARDRALRTVPSCPTWTSESLRHRPPRGGRPPQPPQLRAVSAVGPALSGPGRSVVPCRWPAQPRFLTEPELCGGLDVRHSSDRYCSSGAGLGACRALALFRRSLRTPGRNKVNSSRPKTIAANG